MTSHLEKTLHRQTFAKRAVAAALLFSLMLLLFAGAAGSTAASAAADADDGHFRSFRDIPGVTDEEIAAIEALQAEGAPLIYAASRSTELFEKSDGELSGYTVLFCRWLSELFGLEFLPKAQGLGAMIENLGNGSIQFATLSVTPERQERYFMTDAIAQRSVIMLRPDGSEPIANIRRERLPRYVFTEGSVILQVVADALKPGTYETLVVESEGDAYHALINGEADAFLATNTMEAAFDTLGGIHTEDFLPLIFLPAAMTAQDPKYEPIISVVGKALQHNAYRHLTNLYAEGYLEYKKYKYSLLLTEEEAEFLRNTPAIPVATYYMSYPLSFFNTSTNAWEGISIDILDEISLLSDLEFTIINEPNLQAYELLELLDRGEAHIIPYLVASGERMGRVLWSQSDMYIYDHFVLLSKQSTPNVELNDIPFSRVGVPAHTSFSEYFHEWFPNAIYVTEYPTMDDVVWALDRGEVDFIMGTQSRVAALTNYYNLSDYKANYIFNHPFEARMVFNKNQHILRSVVDKALGMVDTSRIVEQWLTRTYNVEAMRLQTQRLWLIGTIILSFIVISLVFVLYVRSRQMAEKQQGMLIELDDKSAQLSDALRRANDANEAKTDFLAKMSHEIRTPMNAVIGMTELALQADDIDTVHDYAFNVKQASKNLLSLINDILDISKIEAGKLEIVEKNYYVASLLNDVVNIAGSRAADSKLPFSVKVDCNIPQRLRGDEAKVRQTLVNVLGNAVKYTEKGHISLSVFISKEGDDDKLNLVFKVSDTGIGIKEEDIENIFSDFSQINKDRNVDVESTGLGLAITHKLVYAMGGEIAVDSEYGKGSVFTVTIPQIRASHEPLAIVYAPRNKKVLVYDHRDVYVDSLAYTLGNLGLKYDVASDNEGLFEKLDEGAHRYLFISYLLYLDNKDKLEQRQDDINIYVLTEFNEMAPNKHMHTLTMPAYCTQVANVLNGMHSNHVASTAADVSDKLFASGARVLIVDDINTNLKVAEGLLKQYNLNVDLCKGGADSINLVRNAAESGERYDLIFMDHKMPGVDGVEATVSIRSLGNEAGYVATSSENASYYKNVPIVALTANAIIDQKTMFLDNGFSDVLLKPIDIAKLDAILRKWLPTRGENL